MLHHTQHIRLKKIKNCKENIWETKKGTQKKRHEKNSKYPKNTHTKNKKIKTKNNTKTNTQIADTITDTKNKTQNPNIGYKKLTAAGGLGRGGAVVDLDMFKLVLSPSYCEFFFPFFFSGISAIIIP